MNIKSSAKEKFIDRHIGPNEQDTLEMLKEIGVDTLEKLIDEIVPEDIRLKKNLDLPAAVSEYRLLKEMKQIASKNKIFKSYIGLGYYNCITPPVIQRNIFENPGWYTSYTPYQAEISQGRLEALINFQTMIMDMTGMEIANASLLDEGTAAAEAMSLMFVGRKNKNANKFFVSENCLTQTLDIIKTRSEPLNIQVEIGDHSKVSFNDTYFGALVQYPDINGCINEFENFGKKIHAVEGMFCVSADLMSLAVLTPPAEFGADIVVGSAQRFGVPMGYGGPHAAYFATLEKFKRQVPGRIIGVSVDSQGNKAYRMALQTREQHIRREKATSNICTSQVLLAVMAGMYAVYHGPEGIKQIALRIHGMAVLLNKTLQKAGFKQLNKNFFDTLLIEINDNKLLENIKNHAEFNEINFRYTEDGNVGISVDETTTIEEVKEIILVFEKYSSQEIVSKELKWEITEPSFSASFKRESAYLQHPVFNLYHSETEMLRYLKHLENKDLSLTHSMIPLGSCTMKLNATTEMIPLSWPEFNEIHPFAPVEQVQGYAQIFDKLSKYLNEITGFDGISLQPNSGAQGEFAGLMVIREYFKDRNENYRNVALIPSSAHGTNPASAVMAGMKVVVVKCDDNGNIDVNDLKSKAELHKNELAALMITYPSTHGVFETTIREICRIIHKNGGQVYMDGANMNAQVGLTNPAIVGSDVCHLNLHKTFCIPHGGGGPGMGPIGVKKHLLPYLPGHPIVKINGEKAMTAISAAPWGSASILIISYIYIRLTGADGLTNASVYSILNANYLKAKLEEHFKTLYSGHNGRVAHEMIIDPRNYKQTAGIDAEDIAKRLIDYGFHAPTMSWPVPGTLMIEPTESESKAELDRFCKAMISIRNEIKEIENGLADKNINVLKNAPHTIELISSDKWDLPYSRSKAAFPLESLRNNKFWSTVGRVDSTYGDRNLMCACPPIEEYMEDELIS